MSKPWLETWEVTEGKGLVSIDNPIEQILLGATIDMQQVILAGAAPDMCRALLRIEKQDGPHRCSCCLLKNEPGGCWLNEALTKRPCNPRAARRSAEGAGDMNNPEDSDDFNHGRDWQRRQTTAQIVAFLRRPHGENGKTECSVDREHMAQCIERGEHLK
jgi:hypothetical protein